MSATWDQSKFDSALARYIQTSSKDMVTILNTKAYYIARKSLWFTKKAQASDIRAFMSKYVTVTTGRRVNEKTGRMKKFKDYTFEKSSGSEAPVIALIINANRGHAGRKGFKGPDMRKAMEREQGRRMKSIGYIKSGWIYAIRKLEPHSEDKSGSSDGGVNVRGVPSGHAIIANENSMTAVIGNRYHSNWDKRGGFYAVVSKGLQRAFDDEAKSMEQYILKKQKAAAEQLNKG